VEDILNPGPGAAVNCKISQTGCQGESKCGIRVISSALRGFRIVLLSPVLF
jgi:hypothetical protein